MSLKEMPAPQASRTAPGHLHEIVLDWHSKSRGSIRGRRRRCAVGLSAVPARPHSGNSWRNTFPT